jgi:hypothetical protein
MAEQPADFPVTSAVDDPAAPAVTVAGPWDRAVVMVPVFAVLALAGGRLPSFSRAASGYVLVTGAVLIWLGHLSRRRAARPAHPPPTSFVPGVAWWLLPVLVFGPVEAVDYLLGSTHEHPTVSMLLDPLLAADLPRSAVYLGWLTAFWTLVRR